MQIASGAIIKTFADIQKAALDAVSLIKGGTADMAPGFAKLATNMSKELPFTAPEILQGVSDIERAGFTAAQAWALLPRAMKMAVAGNMEVKDTFKGLTGILTAYGLRVSDTKQLMSNFERVMTAVSVSANETNASFEEIIQGMSTAAPMARAFGRNFEEVAAVIGQYHQNLIAANKSGTFHTMFLRDMTRAFVANKKQWQDMRIDILNLDGSFKSTVDIMKQFEAALSKLNDEGKVQAMLAMKLPFRSSNAILSLLGMSDAVAKLTDEIHKGGNVMQEMYDTKMTGLSNRLILLRNHFTAVSESMGQAFLPTANKLIEVAFYLITSFDKLSDAQKSSVASWMLFGAVLGPVLIVVGMVIRSIQLLLTPFQLLIPMLRVASSVLVGLAMRGFMPLISVLGMTGRAFLLAAGSVLRFTMAVGSQAIVLLPAMYSQFVRIVGILTTFGPTLQRVVSTVRSYNNGLIQVITVQKLVWNASIYQRFGRAASEALKTATLALGNYIFRLRVAWAGQGVFLGSVTLLTKGIRSLTASFASMMAVGVITWFRQNLGIMQMTISVAGTLNGALLLLKQGYIAAGLAAMALWVGQSALILGAGAAVLFFVGVIAKVSGAWDYLLSKVKAVINWIRNGFTSAAASASAAVGRMMDATTKKMHEMQIAMMKLQNIAQMEMEQAAKQDANKQYLLRILNAQLFEDYMGIDTIEEKMEKITQALKDGLIDALTGYSLERTIREMKTPIEAAPPPGTEDFQAPEDDKKKDQNTPTHPFSAKEFGSLEEYTARIEGQQEPLVKLTEQLLKAANKNNAAAEEGNNLLKKLASKETVELVSFNA
jgi:TP901 family phage tail tape measure protein